MAAGPEVASGSAFLLSEFVVRSFSGAVIDVVLTTYVPASEDHY